MTVASGIAVSMSGDLKIGTKSSATKTAQDFLAGLGRPFLGEALFDAIEDIVYFVKDGEARYLAVNDTLAHRCGFASKSGLIGQTAREAFPAPLGEGFHAQDIDVLRTGAPIQSRLELHLYPGGASGWCLTWKEPLRDRRGKPVGLCGLSRDLPRGVHPSPDLGALSQALSFARQHLDRALRVPEIAARAGLSVFQFDQRVRTLFGVSAGQYLTRVRIERACERLAHSRDAVALVAQDCGYSDQAAFTRQFRRSVGMTPLVFRKARIAG